VDAAPGPARARDQGTGTPAHLEENVAAAALRLTDAEAARLDGLYRAAG
jgi:aryl-alcohol dehydrogenase-like predicted oxidoreductase